MLSTSTNVLFPGHNHLLTTSADGPSGTKTFLKMDSMVVSWWIVAFWPSVSMYYSLNMYCTVSPPCRMISCQIFHWFHQGGAPARRSDGICSAHQSGTHPEHLWWWTGPSENKEHILNICGDKWVHAKAKKNTSWIFVEMSWSIGPSENKEQHTLNICGDELVHLETTKNISWTSCGDNLVHLKHVTRNIHDMYHYKWPFLGIKAKSFNFDIHIKIGQVASVVYHYSKMLWKTHCVTVTAHVV